MREGPNWDEFHRLQSRVEALAGKLGGLERSLSLALTQNEARVVLRALGVYVSDYQTGRPEQDGDIDVAIVLSDRLRGWHL